MFKDKKRDMSETEKKAKKSVLSDMIKEMSGMMAEPLRSMKKVTVAAKDDAGLKKGLEKAEEILESKEEMSDAPCEECGEMHEHSHEMSDESEEESEEQPMEEEQSLEDIEQEIKKLEELKRKKMGM